MDVLIIGLVAVFASSLTFFSGFGLGTILMPAFILFFPIDTAIALAAVVHFLNNLLKFIILYKKAHWSTVLKFGIPAFIFALMGAKLLFSVENLPAVFSYELFSRKIDVTYIKLILSSVIIFFAVLELMPFFAKITFAPKFMPLGGMISGFFGGLSGHQGAFRSMFLIKCGLEKEQFIATGVIIACIVDISRMAVYFEYIEKSSLNDYVHIMAAAVFCAFAGVLIGNKLMKKITMKYVQAAVSVMLFIIAVLLGLGII